MVFVVGMFLNKDAWSLAKYNIRSGSSIQVGERVRGGKNRWATFDKEFYQSRPEICLRLPVKKNL